MPEIFDHFRILESDSQRPAVADVFLDLRDATSLPSADQVRAVASEIGSAGPGMRFGACAIIAGRDAMFGMSRMFSVFAENYFRSISVFRSAADGERWLEAQRSGISS
jgi:hypothetical protein